MPTFNFRPILFPRAKKTDDLYDMLTDILDIKQREMAIDQGGEIFNPGSYDVLIKGYEAIINDSTISENKKRDAQKKLLDLEKKKIKTELDRKKDIDTGDLKQSVEQDLRELEFEFPENPIAYSVGALTKFQDILYGTEDRDGLYDLIDILQHHYVDTTTLEDLKIQYESELTKYAEIVDAFERGDTSLLSEYAVVYTPHQGKVKTMRIIARGEVDPSYSQPTNLKFARDKAGNLAIVPIDQTGMQIYFIRANAMSGDKYFFGNNEFDYTNGLGWETKKPELFDYRRIKHAPLHSIPTGNFVKDSKDRLFYVNQDRSFSPVKNPRFKDELEYQEDKVYHLSPIEELNVLPGAIEHKLPLPILERWNREAETAKFDYWKAFKEEWPKAVEKVLGFPERILPTLPSRIREFHRGTMRKIEEERTRPKPLPEEPKWEAPEIEPLPLIGKAKEFIKKITPKY